MSGFKSRGTNNSILANQFAVETTLRRPFGPLNQHMSMHGGAVAVIAILISLPRVRCSDPAIFSSNRMSHIGFRI